MADLIQPGKATVIVGGQYGSEAKGLAAAIVHQMAGARHAKWSTTNAGAQAGHTTVMRDGSKFVCYHLPTIGVLDFRSDIYVNAGAIIDPDLFAAEIEQVASVTGEHIESLRGRIYVDPCAAVIKNMDQKIDAQSARIGSTMKGIGPALAQKIMRQDEAVVMNDERMHKLGVTIRRVNLPHELSRKKAVTIEVPQGTGLSLNSSGHYPYTTSRECWLGQGMTDAGLHPSFLGKSVMVCRTLPIRVGNVFNDEGVQIGTSGPFAYGSLELDWDRHLAGIEPERTTVTKRVRRIATWSESQFIHGLAMNRPDLIILTFCNYLSWDCLRALQASIERCLAAARMAETRVMFSWGPKSHQVSPMIEACEVHCRPHDEGQALIMRSLMGELDEEEI